MLGKKEKKIILTKKDADNDDNKTIRLKNNH